MLQIPPFKYPSDAGLKLATKKNIKEFNLPPKPFVLEKMFDKFEIK